MLSDSYKKWLIRLNLNLNKAIVISTVQHPLFPELSSITL